MSLRRNVRPSMRGILRSRVTTSGFSARILLRATYGSGAVITDSMRGWADSISVSTARTIAESSTISTLIFLSPGNECGTQVFLRGVVGAALVAGGEKN